MRARPRLVAGLAAALAVAFGFSLCRRGIVLSDEGYLLLQALDMTHGKVLYRDMDAFVAPGVWFLLAALFRCVEPSVLAARCLALVSWCGSLWAVVAIVRRLAGPRAAAAAFVAYLVASVWAFPAWTWCFYSPWSMLFALLACERLLRWVAAERRRDLVLLGAFLAASLLFKQNYGALALAGCGVGLAALLIESRESLGGALRDGLALLPALALGAGLVAAPVVAYFAAHHALGAAFEALVVHPFGSFLGTHDIPYLGLRELFGRDLMTGSGRLTYGSFGLTHTAMRSDWLWVFVRGLEILHVLLYWIPPLVFATASWLAFSPLLRGLPADGGLATLLAFAAFLFLGVFPRADLNHLMNVTQPVLALAAVVVQRLLAAGAAASRRPRRVFGTLGGVLAGAYLVVAVYWYQDLLRTLDAEVARPRGGVLVSRAEEQMLGFEVAAIRAGSRPGEPVLTLPGLAMLNFLADRPMPGRFYNFYAVHIAHDGGAGVVAEAEGAGVQLVVADYNDFFSEHTRLRDYAPVLTEYLRRSFEPAFSVAIDEHLFLRRRAQPLPPREGRSALADCDAGDVRWQRRTIWPHLLFDVLYHYPEQDARDAPDAVSTLCRVVLPGPAELRFRVGTRQPTEVRAGSELVAELWVHREGRPDEAVFRERLPLHPVSGWASPPGEERSVELSRFAGEAITLIFHTRFRGEVRMNPLDLKGFAMVWQDPRLEILEASSPGYSR